MLHSKERTYKPISDLNKKFPYGFKKINFRLLPDELKFQIISNKLSQMEKNDFKEICTLLNFTLDDIDDEKQQLTDYLHTLKRKIKNSPHKPKKRSTKITQKEIEEVTLKPDLFNQNLDQEYNRIFPLLIRNIKKKYNFKELGKVWKGNNHLIFNLEIIMEADVRKLNDIRKNLSLKIINETDSKIIQQHQSKIERLKTFIISYVSNVYTPIIKKYQSLKKSTTSKLEQFCFAVVDALNKKLEKVTKKFAMDITELYFDDGLELRIMVKNKLLSKFPFRSLNFEDLDNRHKRIIIQILKTEL